MDQDKIGKLIKEIRLKNNMTQSEFANIYGVTYQAVSKWENGKNLPDMLLLKQICKDNNINIDDILDGKITNKKRKPIYIVIPIIIIFLLLILFLIINNKNKQNFEFKTISSNCSTFKINGSIAYNDNKSVIYISNIEYCGETDKNKIYKSINCNLYEQNNIIGSCNYKNNTNLTLNDYLKNVNISINNEKKICKDYLKNDLYLQIEAKDDDNKTINYNIPLSIKECN